MAASGSNQKTSDHLGQSFNDINSKTQELEKLLSQLPSAVKETNKNLEPELHKMIQTIKSTQPSPAGMHLAAEAKYTLQDITDTMSNLLYRINNA